MKKTLKIFTVDAFTNKPFFGNPAGVVLLDSFLATETMQLIAKELKLSETVFIVKQEDAYRLRYFTPSQEIDFCGHATLSAAWVILLVLQSKAERLALNTNVGLVTVDYKYTKGVLSLVSMTQISPQVKPYVGGVRSLCEALGIKDAELDRRFPIKLAYTGLWCLLVPLKTKEAVMGAQPDFTKLSLHNKNLGAAGTHLFSFDTPNEDHLLYTRDFSPSSGVDEDPVTGSAAGALAGYLYLEHIVRKTDYKILQNNSFNRPGELFINIKDENGRISVQVGGQAVLMINGILNI